MKTRMNIRSIIILATIFLASMFFINICFATNNTKVSVETAKLREKPNTDSKVLELISLNENVEIVEEQGEWCKVKYKNIIGYLRKDLLETKEENKSETSETENNQFQESENETQEVVTNQDPEATVVNPETSNQNEENQEEKVENTLEEEVVDIQIKNPYKVSEKIKLRIIPLINAMELEEIKENETVTVLEILNGWSKVENEDGQQGWIRKDKLITEKEDKKEEQKESENKVEEKDKKEEVKETTELKSTSKTMYVAKESINVRKEANTTSQVVKQLTINKEVTVKNTENGWCEIEVDGVKGYILESLLSATKQVTSRSTTAERTNVEEKAKVQETPKTETKSVSTGSGSGSSVVAYAQQFLGTKYVYGGTTTNGFDCSGFTQYVYKNFGVNLNRTAGAQYSNGTPVSELQAGDLVMFGKSGINHVGIYIGGNTFIHAANPSRGVTTDTLASGYYKTNYVGARRIF